MKTLILLIALAANAVAETNNPMVIGTNYYSCITERTNRILTAEDFLWQQKPIGTNYVSLSVPKPTDDWPQGLIIKLHFDWQVVTNWNHPVIESYMPAIFPAPLPHYIERGTICSNFMMTVKGDSSQQVVLRSVMIAETNRIFQLREVREYK